MAQMGGGMFGADMVKNMIPEIRGIQKIGCKADGEKAWRCDVEMEVSQGGTTQKTPANMRFVKTSDGWAVTN